VALPPGEGIEDASDAPGGGTVVVHVEVEPPQLMPLLRPDAWCERIVVHDVYEALLRSDPFTHELGPELAESWEVSDDGRVLTFHLREGVLWHDGEPFSSDDVRFTFDTIRDPAVLAPAARANFEVVERYEAPDERTFRIYLSEPSFLILQHIESTIIIPRHIFGQGDINSHPHLRRPVGTGPFRVTAFRSGREVVLERHDGYWGMPAKLDRIIYRFARDRTLALQMLRRGDLDVMPRLTATHVEQVRDDRDLLSRYELTNRVAPGFSFLVYNIERHQFADPRVRRALTMLIDRDTILCALESCLGQVVSGPFPVGHPGGDPELEPWPFDPAGARALLDQAGWRQDRPGAIRRKDGQELYFTLLIPAISTNQHRIATLIQQDLLRSGVRIDLHSLDWSVFLERLNEHDFDVASLQFSMDWETDYYVLYHSSQREGGMNYGSWQNAEADELLEQLRRELDPGRRIELQRRFHRILHQEQPHTFLFARVESGLANRSIHNAIPGIPWHDERIWFVPPGDRDAEGRPRR
jgi:peptide/nickel transport system substrate-binding protein